jgi:hypothetical protein
MENKYFFVWSKVDASNRYIPFVILEVDKQTKEELEDRIKRWQLWSFIAERLQGQTIRKVRIKHSHSLSQEAERFFYCFSASFSFFLFSLLFSFFHPKMKNFISILHFFIRM